jgi:hypothetical protein
MKNIEKVIVYHGTHKGVSWDINHIERSYAQWWTYYIYLDKKKMLPEEFKLFNAPLKHTEFGGKIKSHYDYYKIPDIDLHCGITFYEKNRDIFLEHFILKIGCDYNHYWDEGKQYQLEDIIMDVKNSVDSFLSRFSYKRWCGNCGAIVDKTEGIITEPDDNQCAFKCNICLNKKPVEANQ